MLGCQYEALGITTGSCQSAGVLSCRIILVEQAAEGGIARDTLGQWSPCQHAVSLQVWRGARLFLTPSPVAAAARAPFPLRSAHAPPSHKPSADLLSPAWKAAHLCCALSPRRIRARGKVEAAPATSIAPALITRLPKTWCRYFVSSTAGAMPPVIDTVELVFPYPLPRVCYTTTACDNARDYRLAKSLELASACVCLRLRPPRLPSIEGHVQPSPAHQPPHTPRTYTLLTRRIPPCREIWHPRSRQQSWPTWRHIRTTREYPKCDGFTACPLLRPP